MIADPMSRNETETPPREPPPPEEEPIEAPAEPELPEEGPELPEEAPEFPEEGRRDAIRAVGELRKAGYRPRLHAGVHFGSAHAIGGDYIGVDVNIPARLCEAAGEEQILVSRTALRNDLGGARLRAEPVHRPLRGTPPGLEIYAFCEGLNANGKALARNVRDRPCHRPDR